MNTTGHTAHGRRASGPAAILVVAVAYAGVAGLSHLTRTLPGHVSPIFPSAGVGLAAALILGRPALLGIWLGSIAANAVVYAQGLAGIFQLSPKDALVRSFIGIGATLAAGAGAWLVRRSCGDEHPLHSVRNVLMLVTKGAFGSAAISATIGLITLSVVGFSPWRLFGYSWLTGSWATHSASSSPRRSSSPGIPSRPGACARGMLWRRRR
jgi:integral membrane sensor domain MASE1